MIFVCVSTMVTLLDKNERWSIDAMGRCDGMGLVDYDAAAVDDRAGQGGALESDRERATKW